AGVIRALDLSLRAKGAPTPIDAWWLLDPKAGQLSSFGSARELTLTHRSPRHDVGTVGSSGLPPRWASLRRWRRSHGGHGRRGFARLSRRSRSTSGIGSGLRTSRTLPAIGGSIRSC